MKPCAKSSIYQGQTFLQRKRYASRFTVGNLTEDVSNFLPNVELFISEKIWTGVFCNACCSQVVNISMNNLWLTEKLPIPISRHSSLSRDNSAKKEYRSHIKSSRMPIIRTFVHPLHHMAYRYFLWKDIMVIQSNLISEVSRKLDSISWLLYSLS